MSFEMWGPIALGILAAMSGFTFLLVLGAYDILRRQAPNPSGSQRMPPPTRLSADELLPMDLGGTYARALVVFANHACGPCMSLMAELKEIDLGAWQLVVVMGGRPAPMADMPKGLATRGMRPDGSFPIPAGAVVIADDDGKSFRDLQIKVTPTLLFLQGGRVVEQRAGPSGRWVVDARARLERVGAGTLVEA